MIENPQSFVGRTFLSTGGREFSIEIPVENLPEVIKGLIELLNDKGEALCKEVLEERGLLMSGLWQVDDVIMHAEEMGVPITVAEAMGVLDNVGRHFDASLGITWDTIEAGIDALVEEREEAEAREVEKGAPASEEVFVHTQNNTR